MLHAQRLNSNRFPAKSLAKNRLGYSTPCAPICLSVIWLEVWSIDSAHLSSVHRVYLPPKAQHRLLARGGPISVVVILGASRAIPI